MQRVILLVAVLAFTLPLAAQAQAAQTPAQRAQHTIAFFDHHRKAAATLNGQRVLWRAIHLLTAATRTVQAEDIYPPHHALWLCIHGGETGSWAAVNPNGHYGGLQMTWGWLGYIAGDPAAHSQAEQEWAAERAWAANGYSYGFLYGQWYEWDNADGCGTTG
jgi:hypothetical protein